MAHIILFENAFQRGAHKHVVAAEPNLAAPEDSWFNDRTSSFVILSGNWQLYQDINFQNPFPRVFGPGIYAVAQGASDNTISSLQPTTAAATQTGDAPDGYITLFEHANFHGAHKHLFTAEHDLTRADGPPFSDTMSSCVVQRARVEQTAWQLCSDVDYGGPYNVMLSTGAYSWIGGIGLPNDDVSSAQTFHVTSATQNVIHGDEAFGEVILFEHENFRGDHKHVYKLEPDLGAADDNTFLNKTSSFWINHGAWAFCAQPDFQQILPTWHPVSLFGMPPVPAPIFFTPGAFPSCQQAMSANDAIASLHMPVPDIYFFSWDTTGDPQLVWLIVVVGGSGSGMNVNLDGTDVTSQMQLQQTYKDSLGFAVASVWSGPFHLSRGQAHHFTVTEVVSGTWGSPTRQTNMATWQTSPLAGGATAFYRTGSFIAVQSGSRTFTLSTTATDVQLLLNGFVVFTKPRAGTGTVELFSNSVLPHSVLIREAGVGSTQNKEQLTAVLFDGSNHNGRTMASVQAEQFVGQLTNSPDGLLFAARGQTGLNTNLHTVLHLLQATGGMEVGSCSLDSCDLGVAINATPSMGVDTSTHPAAPDFVSLLCRANPNRFTGCHAGH
jgi:hypothetical protein